jgi:hypothetical protein
MPRLFHINAKLIEDALKSGITLEGKSKILEVELVGAGLNNTPTLPRI